MNKKQKIKCNAIIHSTSVAAAVVGAIPIAGSDSRIISSLQTLMTTEVAKVFDQDISEGCSTGMGLTPAASSVGRGVAQIASGKGGRVGAATNAITAAAITEGMGWALVKEYDNKSKRA